MRFMRYIQRTILLLICLTILSVQAAYSCSCFKMTFEERFARTGFIFVGKVIEIKEDTTIKRKPYESRKYIVKVQIIESFKGAKGKEINLVQFSHTRKTSCPQWTLQENETYLIYGGRSGKDNFYDVACSPTKRFDANDSTYKALQAYKAKNLKSKK